jgi:hypothetical protein
MQMNQSRHSASSWGACIDVSFFLAGKYILIFQDQKLSPPDLLKNAYVTMTSTSSTLLSTVMYVPYCIPTDAREKKRDPDLLDDVKKNNV